MWEVQKGIARTHPVKEMGHRGLGISVTFQFLSGSKSVPNTFPTPFRTQIEPISNHFGMLSRRGIPKRFQNDSKTIPKRFQNRFRTDFEPISNRFGTDSEQEVLLAVKGGFETNNSAPPALMGRRGGEARTTHVGAMFLKPHCLLAGVAACQPSLEPGGSLTLPQ